ncbi:MAG TPA: MTAP family purine nucleoside phosphorylase [Solirubrobacterales bacterium]|jgi:5'-methylthioadenosine phosphorylase|nr:MTAP family purine nucleoside phosphorylase [Solirubrobacterales bacterium]
MGRLAVVLGSNALGPGGEEIAAAAAEHGAAIVQRHGSDGGPYVLPHLIDHAANLRPLVEQGCDRVLAIGSVGSLHPWLGVGTLICPDDFIAPHLDASVYPDSRAHSTPGFDPRWRSEVIEAWGAGGEAPRDGGVYWQTIGPRFETPAEIRLMAAHAEVVGMTIAGECVIAGELGLAYAALCVVDNLANGLGPGEVTVAELEADRAANAARLRDGLAAVLPQLGAVGR